MKRGYIPVEPPLRLDEAAEKFGLKRLHPMDKKLFEQLPEFLYKRPDFPKPVVTMIKEQHL